MCIKPLWTQECALNALKTAIKSPLNPDVLLNQSDPIKCALNHYGHRAIEVAFKIFTSNALKCT